MAQVDVVMALYRGQRWVNETVESLAEQTFTDWNLIAVDDACPEHTGDTVERAHPGATVLRLPANVGPASARTAGVAASSAPFVAFLDQDDLWHPQKLEKQVEALTLRPRAGACHTDCLLIDEAGCALGEASTNPRRRLDWDGAPLNAIVRAQFRDNRVKNGSVLMRRTAWDDVGGYDPRYLSGADDWVLWLLFLMRGWRLAHIAEPLHYWRKHAGNNSEDAKRNAEYMVAKRHYALRYAHKIGPRLLVRTFRP